MTDEQALLNYLWRRTPWYRKAYIKVIVWIGRKKKNGL
jgi:hypothetical protein